MRRPVKWIVGGLGLRVTGLATLPAGAVPAASTRPTSLADIRAVTPALADYDQPRLKDEVWKRPGPSPRDRSLVTIAVIISRGQTALLGQQLRLAIDNGVKPAEISEVVTHLAFYAGWGQAMAAVPVVRNVFAERHVRPSELPPIGGPTARWTTGSRRPKQARC